MYKEVSITAAFNARHNGLSGYVIFPDTGNTSKLEEIFPSLDGCRFVVDMDAPAPVPEVEIPEAKMDIETPEKPKRKYGRMTDAERETAKQKILKAWAGGDHTIQQICEMTGYNYRTVRQYIPVTVNG